MERKQFTFYRSYYDALVELPRRDQANVILAICGYALREEEPSLTGTAKAIFSLIRPTLDAARRKAEGGMHRASGDEKRPESRGRAAPKPPEASGGDAAEMPGRHTQDRRSKREDEEEQENESESEYECTPPVPPETGVTPDPLAGFAGELRDAVAAWLAYKAEKRQSYKPKGLQALLSEIRSNARRHGDTAVAGVIRVSMANNYQGIVFDRLTQRKAAGGSQELLDMIERGEFADD